jgi:epoxide hydrolase
MRRMAPTPYRIDVPQAVLDDLNQRLANTRWPATIPGSGWDYGADVDYVRELCEYWRTRYDWRKHEAALNEHPQFLSSIDGVDIHYWHIRGKGPNPLPLCIIHGWPGSIYEFYDLIGPLTDPAAHDGDPADSFDLVVPALPGFGFGGKPQERGWGITRTAAAFDTLMSKELGYDRYVVQGGDWGGILSAKMASAHAGHVTAAHLNFVLATPPSKMSEDEQKAAEERTRFQAQETGYSNVQGTKPMSLGIAQSDSPAGIAAWIVEKFRTWSDCGGDLESVYTKDQLLTNLMFYWAPNSSASSARIYFESQRDPDAFRYVKPETPIGVAVFPGEPWRVPRSWAEPRFNIKRWNEMPRGGHFAAMEQPELLLGEIREFFRDYR